MRPETILTSTRELFKKHLPPGWNGPNTTVTASRKIVEQGIILPDAKSLLRAVSVSADSGKRSPSEKLWCFRQVPYISEHKTADPKHAEKRLEKAVVNEETGLGRNWGNQISTASGLSKNRGDSRRNIDLVRMLAEDRYRFIELKVKRGTNTPLSAGIELLEYALLHVWVRQHLGELISDRTIPDCDASASLLKARVIELEVLAPDDYYFGYNEDGMRRLQAELERICVALGAQAGMKMQFRYKTLAKFDLKTMPDHPNREWLALRFEAPADRYLPFP